MNTYYNVLKPNNDATSQQLKKDYDTATELFQQGEYKKSIKILELLDKNFQNLSEIKSLLGASYLENNNSGKAITIFENLISIQPDNINFIVSLANAYLLRGWHNKAIDILKNAISIYENNFSLSLENAETSINSFNTTEAKKILNQLLQKNTDRNDILTLSVYFHLFFINLQDKDFKDLKNTLKYLSSISLKLEESRDHTVTVLLNISEKLVQAKIFEPAKDILDTAEIIDSNNEKIKVLKANIHKLSTPQTDVLQSRRSNLYSINRRSNDFYRPKKPYVRSELKIGRNLPCPCGSEKKFKKCCGK